MKLVFLTGSRSEWGALAPVLRIAVAKHTCFVQICGEHLAAETTEMVIDIAKKLAVPIFFAPESVDANWLICNGDRPELLMPVARAYQKKTGIAHISGGDYQSDYLVDEPTRRALTQFAHLHFVCTESSRERLLRMGESEHRVFNVGSPLVDDLLRFQPKKNALQKNIEMNGGIGYYAILVHPSKNFAQKTKKIVEWAEAQEGYCAAVIRPNTDQGFGPWPSNIAYLDSMPRNKFLNFLWNSQCFISNSSAIFLEAQYLGVPCVHVSPRNLSREEAFPGHAVCLANFVNLDNLKIAIQQARRNDARAPARCCCRQNGAHGNGQAAQQIMELLELTGCAKKYLIKPEWK